MRRSRSDARARCRCAGAGAIRARRDLGRLDPEAIAKVRPRRGQTPRQRPRSCTTRCCGSARLTEAEARAVPVLERMARCAGARPARRSQSKAPEADSGFRPSGSLNSALSGLKRGSSPRPPCPPPDQAGRRREDDALVEILRGSARGLGPVTPTARSSPTGSSAGGCPSSGARCAREQRRHCSRDASSPGVERRAMVRPPPARAHPPLHGPARLRSEIEPVAARDFLRFLFAWQHVAEETRLEGADALPAVIERARRLRGAGQGVGDRDPARAPRGLSASWLDAHCLAGRTSCGPVDGALAANGRRAPCGAGRRTRSLSSSHAPGAAAGTALASLSARAADERTRPGRA